MLIDVGSHNWQDKVLSSKIPVIVDFWAPWCPWCMRLMPVFDEVSGQYDGKLIFVKVNVEEQENVAKANDIAGIPIMKMFYNGKKVGELVGFMTKDKLVQGIDAILASLDNSSVIKNTTMEGKSCC
jgi:thioredoxin 1